MPANLGFQRAFLRLVVVVGFVLCLSPFAAQMRLTWVMVMKPAIVLAGQRSRANQEQLGRLNDSAKMRRALISDPLMLAATFVVAPAGVVLIALSMKRLRHLRRAAAPTWPAGYQSGSAPR